MNRKAWEERQRRDKEIIKALKAGQAVSQVSEAFCLSPAYIRLIARPHNLLPSKASVAEKRKNIILDYITGQNEITLGEKYGVRVSYICGLLERNLSNYVPYNVRQREERNENISKEYVQGASLSQLATKYTLHRLAIKGILKKRGVYKPQPHGRPKKVRSSKLTSFD
jgi:hypothetical protein